MVQYETQSSKIQLRPIPDIQRFTTSKENDADIQALMNQTLTDPLTKGNEEGSYVSFFGSRTKIRGVAHRVKGRLIRNPSPTDLSLDLAVQISRSSESLSPPPRSFRPVSLLVDSASRLFGQIPVSCHAIFQYDQKQGYSSRVSLPMPLMILEKPDGITHIEGAAFSRRDSDSIRYQITVDTLEDSGLFVHTVEFRYDS